MRKWIIAALLGVSTLAQAYENARAAEVTFDAVGPAGFKLQGKTQDLKVEENGEQLTVSVFLGKLDTGIELRNKHMKEKYLEVEKFPQTQLTLKKSDVTNKGNGELQGSLKLHGVEKPITVKYTAQADGKSVKMQGTFKLNFKDFGISVPTYLGITVKPDIEVSARFVVDA